MTNTIGVFDFNVMGGENHDPIPTTPIVQITLKSWSSSEKNGIVLSPHLMTEGEIDDYIDALKDDAESLRNPAKVAFRKRLPQHA